MTRYQITLLALAVTAACIGMLAYYSASYMGFPDGHLTEYERSTQPFIQAYSAFSLIVAGIGTALHWRKRNWKPVAYLIPGFLIVTLIVFCVDQWLAATLDNGAGG